MNRALAALVGQAPAIVAAPVRNCRRENIMRVSCHDSAPTVHWDMPSQTPRAAAPRAIDAACGDLKRLLGGRANDSAAVRDHHSRGESYHAPAPPDIVERFTK